MDQRCVEMDQNGSEMCGDRSEWIRDVLRLIKMDQRCDQNGWDRSRYNRIDQMMGQDVVKWIKQVTQDRSG